MSQINSLPVPLFDGLILNGPPRIYACEPGWHWSPAPLADYDLWCVLDGEGQMQVAGQSFALAPNVCFVLPPNAAPRASQNPARRLTVLYLHFGRSNDAPPLPALLGISVRDGASLAAVAARLTRTAQNPLFGANHQAVVLLQSLLYLLHDEKHAPRETPADALVRTVAARVQAAPGEDWAIDRQAKHARLSRSQYGRRFRALFACSPAEWVIEARISRAVQLLCETTMPVGEIAHVLGYRDVFYFSRQFKQKKGVAPTALRQAIQ